MFNVQRKVFDQFDIRSRLTYQQDDFNFTMILISFLIFLLRVCLILL